MWRPCVGVAGTHDLFVRSNLDGRSTLARSTSHLMRWSAGVRACLLLSVGVVTQLDTQHGASGSPSLAWWSSQLGGPGYPSEGICCSSGQGPGRRTVPAQASGRHSLQAFVRTRPYPPAGDCGVTRNRSTLLLFAVVDVSHGCQQRRHEFDLVGPRTARSLLLATETDKDEGPDRRTGRGLHLPWRASAEDTRFELVRGCPQHAFQMFVGLSGEGRVRPDLRRSVRPRLVRTASDGGE